MKTVYKYSIPLREKFEIELPIKASILSIGMQKEEPKMWCLVDTDKPIKTRRFILVGTGHEVAHGNLNHVGTFMDGGGDFVFHVFEVLD